jgi:hypothetical protein
LETVKESAAAAATEAVARAWNRLDPSLLAPWLADDVRYRSLDTELELEGKATVLAYLERKMASIERVGESARIRAALGSLPDAAGRLRPCVISSQGDVDRAALFLVGINRSGLIDRVDVCTVDPDPRQAVASGVVPQ